VNLRSVKPLLFPRRYNSLSLWSALPPLGCALHFVVLHHGTPLPGYLQVCHRVCFFTVSEIQTHQLQCRQAKYSVYVMLHLDREDRLGSFHAMELQRVASSHCPL
jgi:hypothetical protein